MVNVNFSVLIGLYLFPSIVVIVFFWVKAESRKRQGVLPESSKFSYRCPICAYIYIDSSKSSYSRCPRCNSLNIREEAHQTKS